MIEQQSSGFFQTVRVDVNAFGGQKGQECVLYPHRVASVGTVETPGLGAR